MVVQHNLRAMNSNRMLGLTASAQSKSTEKLSSGYKINRAADDAAGLSISEKMRKQIRGLSQASLNAQDGISAVQTAEGALNEVQDMLQRMNELAVKSANGTMSEADRSSIQNEIDQLVTEIDRVAETTKFNETYLLKGVENTSTNEIAAKTTVSYKEDITGAREMSWKANGTPIYATKDGQSTQITATNFNDFLELGSKEVIDTVEIKDGTTIYDAAGTAYIATDLKTALDANPDTKVYATNAGAGNAASDVTAAAQATNTGVTLSVAYASVEDSKMASAQNALATYIANTGISVTTDDAGAVSYSLGAGYNVDNATGKVYAAGDDETVIATLSYAGSPVAAGAGATLTDTVTIAKGTKDAVAPAALASEDSYTVTYKPEDTITAKEGYTIYKQAPTTGEYGSQKPGVVASETEVMSNFNVDTDLLYDVVGNVVEADKLADYFDEEGKYQGGLYKAPTGGGAKLEIGAEQIDDYVDWTRTEATSEEVKSIGALTLSLQVGADTSDNNKISVDIESMGADNLGVAGLKVDGTDSKNADAAVETIAKAIEKVSAQRSALGAVQNRLEHTIANLDNVVENTTAAESQIRDTDMATEMVKFSNSNIIAQAGQAMLAQANQANQGVLSLLG